MLVFYQNKGVSVNVVGVGSQVYKQEKHMKEIAGSEGKVFLFADFSVLTNRFDEIIKGACGK